MTEKTDIRDSDEKVVEIEMERLGYLGAVSYTHLSTRDITTCNSNFSNYSAGGRK